ncbi:hypothetical protein GQS40_02250|uniref:Oligopeptidase F N-terminal domain-containing protein n=1 Tax=Leuconostoc lactis TaxID=1246 RepID=A0A6L7AA45_LEULA|nr:hypothetical protein [Leuconostoc lactis]
MSRELRQEAFETLYDSYIALQNTFASTLSSHVKGHYFQPEVLNIPEETLANYLKTAGLQPYQHLFDQILAQKPYTLPAEQEALLAGAGDIFNASENTFGA